MPALVGLAAAAEEERTTALGASHVVTVTPHDRRGLSVISKKSRGGTRVTYGTLV